MQINGLQVFESLQAEEQDGPIRVHRKSKGSERYHTRVQKKWIKRFGYKMKPCMYRIQNSLFVHPALMPEIKALSLHHPLNVV